MIILNSVIQISYANIVNIVDLVNIVTTLNTAELECPQIKKLLNSEVTNMMDETLTHLNCLLSRECRVELSHDNT